MKGLIFHSPYEVSLADRKLPSVNSNDVVVRIVASGICGTDLGIYHGHVNARSGTVLGHEAVGIVDYVGDKVSTLSSGDRVVINPTIYCSSCEWCLRGMVNHCANKSSNEIGIDRDGTHAEQILIPEKFARKIPHSMEFNRAVLIEPLACVLNNAESARLNPIDRVVIFGAGPIGLLWGLIAKKICLDVTIVESNQYRCRFANQFIDQVINMTEKCDIKQNTEYLLSQLTNDRPTVVVDTTGTMTAEAINIVEKNGRVIVMGFHKDHTALIHPFQIVSKGISVIGAADYNFHFSHAIDLAHVIQPERLITHTLALEDHATVFSQLLAHKQSGKNCEAIKVVFKLSDEFN